MVVCLVMKVLYASHHLLYRPKTSNKHKMFYVESTCVFPESPLSFKLSLTKLVFHSNYLIIADLFKSKYGKIYIKKATFQTLSQLSSYN